MSRFSDRRCAEHDRSSGAPSAQAGRSLRWTWMDLKARRFAGQPVDSAQPVETSSSSDLLLDGWMSRTLRSRSGPSGTRGTLLRWSVRRHSRGGTRVANLIRIGVGCSAMLAAIGPWLPTIGRQVSVTRGSSMPSRCVRRLSQAAQVAVRFDEWFTGVLEALHLESEAAAKTGPLAELVVQPVHPVVPSSGC